MSGLTTTFAWAYPDTCDSGYFVALNRYGIMRAGHPDDVIGISLDNVNYSRDKVHIGYMGIFTVLDDGTCEAGMKCTVKDGLEAGKATTGDRWHVLERIDNNSVKVLFK